MRFVRSTLSAVALAMVLSSAASAVQFDVEYSITGGSNSSFFAGANDPTSGTFTIRWSLASISGLFTNGPATLLSASVVTSSGSTHVLPYMAPDTFGTLNAGLRGYGVGTIPTHSLFFRGSFSGRTGGTGLLVMETGGLGQLIIDAQEVSRIAVPEPATGGLFAVGLLGIAAVSGERFRRARQRD